MQEDGLEATKLMSKYGTPVSDGCWGNKEADGEEMEDMPYIWWEPGRRFPYHDGQGYLQLPSLSHMQLMNRNIKRLAKLVDSEGTTKLLHKQIDETHSALQAANSAMEMGQVTVELSKDVAPVLAKLDAIEQRLQGLEKAVKQNSCVIL